MAMAVRRSQRISEEPGGEVTSAPFLPSSAIHQLVVFWPEVRMVGIDQVV